MGESSTKIYSEMAQIVFLKVTENIFKIEKDRLEIFSGRVYVGYDDVLDSLNQFNTLIKHYPLGLSIHKNFN